MTAAQKSKELREQIVYIIVHKALAIFTKKFFNVHVVLQQRNLLGFYEKVGDDMLMVTMAFPLLKHCRHLIHSKFTSLNTSL